MSIPPPDTTAADRYNRRFGLILFAAYFIVYAIFVVLVYADYKATARPAFAGLNLAIVYGMALILSAFIISLIYMALAKKN